MKPLALRNRSRRKAIKAALVGTATLASAFSHASSKAISFAENSIDKNMELTNLIYTLRAMDKQLCNVAAEGIEILVGTGEPFKLHLRNAGLNLSDANVLADALRILSTSDSEHLTSFSASYNAQLGDEGAIALARSLPNTLQEIGFVGCNIRDEGGIAILNWAGQNPNLKMICVEGNKFAMQTQSLYRSFSQDNPQLTVIF